MDFTQISSTIDNWSSFLSERQSSFESLLRDSSLNRLLEEHKAVVKSADKSNAFTVFEIISDLYYRENFHSDLIAFFLNPNQNHGYGTLGIELLMDLISRSTGWQLDPANYVDAIVVREEGRIDILIKDECSKHAILIENKMNNAGDRDRQIPRYCDILEKQGFTVDAAIYLPMLKYKNPDKSTWEVNDFRWASKIIVIPAVSDINELSLTKDWLEPLAEQCQNKDVASTIRQYIYLITKISNYTMDKISFDKLYNYLLQDDHLDSANSLVSMMNDLPKYLAQRIYDLYSARCFPFTKVWIYRDTDAVFEECMINGVYFKMDVWCDTRTYNILFWAPSDRDISKLSQYNSIKEFLKENGVSIFNDYALADNCQVSKNIPITTSLNEIIDPILAQLSAISDK